MSTEVAVITARRDVLLSPVMDLDVARSRMKEFQEFVAHYLEASVDGGQDGGDYGPIPGAGKKKVLLKSGADKLTELYGLYDEYEVEAKEDFDTKLFYYKVKCILRSRRDDSQVGTGLGSCSTYESKYRWRQQDRTCPKCSNTTIIKGNEQYGGGWLCWAKKGGCGAKYKDDDKAITEQAVGRVENPDIMDCVNTVLKMAKKRAKIDAVIGVTRSSGIFTQDLEDVAMPPAKPPVAVTTEPISVAPPKRAAVAPAPIIKGVTEPQKAAEPYRVASDLVSAAASLNVGGSFSGPVTIADAATKAAEADAMADALMRKLADKTPPAFVHEAPADKGGTFDPDECIDLPEQRAIHRQAREATTLSAKDADTFFRAYLAKAGYVDAEAKGSTKTIPKVLFDEFKREVVAYMSTLK